MRHTIKRAKKTFFPKIALISAFVAAAPALAAKSSVDSLLSFGLEELMAVEVYSAARRSERLLRSDSAVYVITDRDIERIGAPTLPDILRTVPGLQVARFNSHAWAVSSRGYNDIFSNKLLVMVDGRSVYTREFGGTYWHMVDIPPGQIERIEVVRGPGGSLWGSNAYNGVINIITHEANARQGTVIDAAIGEEDRVQLRFSHGMELAGGDLRLDFRFRDRERQETAIDWVSDSWRTHGIGFRYDRSFGEEYSLAASGGFDRGRVDDNRWDAPIAFREEYSIDHIEATLSRSDPGRFGWNLGGYVEQYERELPAGHNIKNFGVSLDALWEGFDRHILQAGAEARFTRGRWVNEYGVDIPDTSVDYRLYSLFAQDTIRLDEADRLNLTLGTKWESYEEGHEWQPTIRLGWAIDEQSHLWAAASRAVRTPTLADTEFNAVIPAYDEQGVIESQPAYIGLVTNPELEAERLDAFEIGYRRSFGNRRSIDIALFHHRYDNLIDRNGTDTFLGYDILPGGLIYYMTQVGGFEAEGNGAELALDWTFGKTNWRAGLSLLDMVLLEAGRSGGDVSNPDVEKSAFVTGHWQATPEVGLSATVRAVDEWCGLFRMRQVTMIDECLDGYVALDLHGSWQPVAGVELSLDLRNLGAGNHYEIDTRGANMTLSEQPLSWMLSARWQID